MTAVRGMQSSYPGSSYSCSSRGSLKAAGFFCLKIGAEKWVASWSWGGLEGKRALGLDQEEEENEKEARRGNAEDVNHRIPGPELFRVSVSERRGQGPMHSLLHHWNEEEPHGCAFHSLGSASFAFPCKKWAHSRDVLIRRCYKVWLPKPWAWVSALSYISLVSWGKVH